MLVRKVCLIAGLVAAMATINQAASADDVKKLSAVDLSVQTHKWDGKKVEVQLRCFYADKDEFRCTGANARVDFTKFTNSEGQQHLEDKCDTIAKAMRRDCLVTVRFTYSGFHSEETNMGTKLTMVEAQDDSGEIVLSKRRKR